MLENLQTEPIAILGMGCRFPGGANTPEAFWQLLRNAIDTVTDIPTTRWNVDQYYDPDRTAPGKMYVRAGAFLDEVDQFDPHFFRMTPREAASLDPQQRLLLEVSWEALEYAGLAPAQLEGSRTGVFVGTFWDDYSAERFYQAPVQQLDAFSTLSSIRSMTAGRIAHTLDLHGPTMQVDTACSSSLLAIHLACQALRNRECELALAGGVSLILSPKLLIGVCKMNALSADGRCKAFSANADGFGRGEGCGMVVLKRAGDAHKDGDPILALIRGSAVNHDGRSLTLTTPGSLAQQAVLRQALANAQIEPQQVQYIEAHGTGTPLGDPIEMSALAKVFGQNRPMSLLVGSVKTNIGHLDPAAGVSGLIKVVLSLRHSEIPAHLHLNEPNPLIPWHNMPITVPTKLTPWQGQPKIAGISAFGLSGTNVHLIVEEAPTSETSLPSWTRPYHILALSARDERALADLAQRYATFLATNELPCLGDICYTAATGRSHFDHRLALVADSTAQLRTQLAAVSNGQQPASLSRSPAAGKSTKPRIAFLFTGQGSQYVNMGKQLYTTHPLFRQTIDRCAEILGPLLGESLLAVLYPETVDGKQSKIDETAYTQPALFVLEYALAQVWQSWGIKPDVVLGHSIGELVAACIAGVFSLEDGLKLVAARGQLMSTLPQDGMMVAVMASEAEVAPYLAPYTREMSLAAVNGPQSVVLSGRRRAVETVMDRLAAQGIRSTPLTVSHAFHSPLMAPMLAEFAQVAEQIRYALPNLALVSTVTGNLVDDEVTTPAYWVRHVREAVRFADGMSTLVEQEVHLLLEIGPKPVLLSMAQAIFDGNVPDVGSPLDPPKSKILLPSLRQDRSDWQQMLESLGTLYVHSVQINWPGFDKDYGRRKVVLPTYPFQRQRYWVTPPEAPLSQRKGGEPLRPLIDKQIKLPLQNQTVFETAFSAETLPFLADYLVHNEVVSPGACQLAMMLSAAELMFGTPYSRQLTDVMLPQALALPAEETRTVQAVLTPLAVNGSGPKAEFQLISFDPQAATAQPTTHATGYVTVAPAQPPVFIDLATLQRHCDQPYAVATFYTEVAEQQIVLGSCFRWIGEVWQGQQAGRSEALARLHVPAAVDSLSGYLLHPGLLDACFQVASMACKPGNSKKIMLPFAVETLRLYQPASADPKGGEWWCHAVQTDENHWNLYLLDSMGQCIAQIDGFAACATSPTTRHEVDAWQEWLYTVEWQPRPHFGLLPDYLPAPAAITAQQAIAPTLWAKHAGEDYQRLLTQLEHLSIDYVLAAFAKAGFAFPLGTRWHAEQIAQQVGVIPRYQRLLARLLTMLAEAGILERTGDQWLVGQRPTPRDLQARAATLRAQHGAASELTLLMRCGEKLSEVLRGLADPLELLFPGGDASLVAPLYTESPVAQVMNTVVQQVIEAVLAQLPDDRGLRILEIGAGTGGTTAGLLPRLPAAQTEYLFTDIGAGFLTKAQERFADYGFLHFQPLNIEQTPLVQGFAPHQVDLVVAANVLHATRNLHETLTHVRQLLKPGGFLVLLEVTSRSRWVDLTFGLTDGWWRFADSRTDHPLLTAVQWETLLLKHGFQTANTVELGGQTVLVAQANTTVMVSDHRWLLFADEQGMGEALATQLRQRGETPLLVYAGQRYQQVDEQTFSVRPDHSEDYQALLAALPNVHSVVHLWSLDTPPVQSVGDLARAMEMGCSTVLYLVQALLHQGLKPAGLWLVTQDAQAVNHQERVTGVAQAALWGMGKVIALEHPELRCSCLDVAGEAALESQAARLYATMTQATLGSLPEDQVALRIDNDTIVRYVARLKRWKAQSTAPLPIQADATYLITDDLGGLGVAVAGWLAAQGARHLLLLGRSQPNPAVQAQFLVLTAKGVSVTVVQADVTNLEQVTAALHQVDASHPLRGVIHTVDVLEDGAFAQQTGARFAHSLTPKVAGAWTLHEATQAGDPVGALDFFVLFSSTASLLGSQGQTNHAAADAFLDAFAHWRRAQGLPALSLNWGPWSADEAADEHSRKPGLAQQGMGVISPQQGLVALTHLLGQNVGQVGVMPIEWSQYLTSTRTTWPLYAAFAQHISHVVPSLPAQPVGLRQQLIQAGKEEARPLLLHHLRSIVAKVLGLPSLEWIDPRQGLMEIGLDSLMAVELRNQLGRALDQQLPSTLIFDYPTLAQLQQFLLQSLLGEAGEDDHTLEPAQWDLAPMEDEIATDVMQLSADELMAHIAKEFGALQ